MTIIHKKILPNSTDLPLDILDAFLREENLNTYANKNVKKASPLRPGSSDYHFEKDDLTFHDTYFGATRFIGEEIVYKNDKVVCRLYCHGGLIE